MKLKEFLGWSVLLLITVWGVLSLIVLLGEDNPDKPMDVSSFIVLKTIAIVSLYECYVIFTHMGQNKH